MIPPNNQSETGLKVHAISFPFSKPAGEITSGLLPSPNGHKPHLVFSAQMDRVWYLPVWHMPSFWDISPGALSGEEEGRAVSVAVTNHEGWQIAELQGITRDLQPNGGVTYFPRRAITLCQIQGILRMGALSLQLTKGMQMEIQVEGETDHERGESNPLQLALLHPELGPVFRGQGFVDKMEWRR